MVRRGGGGVGGVAVWEGTRQACIPRVEKKDGVEVAHILKSPLYSDFV